MLIQESTGGSIQGNYSCSSTTQRCGSRTFMGRLVVARLDACHCQLCGSTKPSASTYEVHITSTWLERRIWCRGQSFLIRRSPKYVHGPFTLVLKNIGKYVTWKKGQWPGPALPAQKKITAIEVQPHATLVDYICIISYYESQPVG